MTPLFLRRAAVGVMAAAFVSGVMACSSGTPPAAQSTASSTNQTSASPGSAGSHEAFTECMADNGVPVPPEGSGPPQDGAPPEGSPPQGPPQHGGSGTPPAPPGVDENTWDKAMQACSSLAPAPPQN
ncbi:hypothetical protein [Mycobacterium sp. MMS18-G62]